MKELDWANLPFGYMKTVGRIGSMQRGNHSYAHGCHLSALWSGSF